MQEKKTEDELESKESKKNKEVAVINNKPLGEMLNIGMSLVDPIDIRPPVIRLIQKSSDVSAFWDKYENVPNIGQFFHTGRLEILDSFECYFLFAAKSVYVDKRKPEEGEKPQYKTIGAMSDDLSIFGMIFRSSALYTLSPLFSATISLKRPMFSIKVKIEKKELTSDKGTWFIPVCRILGEENNQSKLDVLYKNALVFDNKAERVNIGEDEEEGINSSPSGSMPF